MSSNYMDFTSIKVQLRLGNDSEVWRTGWDRSQSHWIPMPFFLEGKFIEQTGRLLDFSSELITAFMQTRFFFSDNQALSRLIWHCHYLLFGNETGGNIDISMWPMLPVCLGEVSDMFYAFVFLSGVPYIQSLHKKRNINETITQDTLKDFELWVYNYRQKTCRWGFSENQWIQLAFYGKVYKLGRLQFEISRFPYDFHAFRCLSDNRVILMAGDKMEFRADGQFDGTNKVYDKDNAWQAQFQKNQFHIIGYPILPSGNAVPNSLTLDAQGWKEIFKKDDDVLNVHIPAIGPLEPLLCHDSFFRALEFFPRHFPEHPFVAFTCTSWLMDSQLEKYLSEISNIIKFFREFYLFPILKPADSDIVKRVFGRESIDINTVSPVNSLQHAIIRHLKSGGLWRTAGGIIFRDNIQYGNQIYRHMWIDGCNAAERL
ncbi:MAG: acyltransferase domain-containing protein [Sedimentisphaerales bacterium]